MQDDKCIICSSVDAIPLETLGTIGGGHSSVPGEPSSSCSILNSNLWSVFILTKVLHLPAEGCYQLLAEADGLNFGDWIKICDSCALLVTKVRTLENQIVELRQEAEGLKKVAQEKFLQGTAAGGQVADNDGSTALTPQGGEEGDNDAPASSAQATTGGEGCHEDDVISRISIFSNSDACVVAPLRKPPPHSPSVSVIVIETDQPLANGLRTQRRRRRKKKCMLKKIAGRLGRHICRICNRSFHSLSRLKGHTWLHGDSGRSLRCRICKKNFSTPGSLKVHMRVHTGERPYQCLVCQRKFASTSALASHRRIYTNEKPKECVFCEKRFVSASALTEHLRRQHLKERPYNCKKCDKWFVTSTNLSLHRYTHMEERPFRCSYCEKSFKSPYVLRQHVRVHFKPFECPVCAKSFVHLKSLEHHKRVHPFERNW